VPFGNSLDGWGIRARVRECSRAIVRQSRGIAEVGSSPSCQSDWPAGNRRVKGGCWTISETGPHHRDRHGIVPLPPDHGKEADEALSVSLAEPQRAPVRGENATSEGRRADIECGNV
jgi:hypothetical protein